MEALCTRLGVDDGDVAMHRRVSVGEIMPRFRDRRVRRLASRIYNRRCPVSPDGLFDMLCDARWVELEALLTDGDAATEEEDDDRRSPCDDHRVLTCGLHDLCPREVQRWWTSSGEEEEDEEEKRWFATVHSFVDGRVARLAAALQARVFRHAPAVLWILSDALNAYRLSRVEVREVHEDWHLSTEAWTRLRSAAVGRVDVVVAVSRRHRAAFACFVVAHEWCADVTDALVLRHRRASPAVTLRYVRQTFGGFVAVDVDRAAGADDADEDEWPKFLTDSRAVPPALVGAVAASAPCVVGAPPDVTGRKRPVVDVDALTADRQVRSVIRTWHKSYESKYADAPTLTALASVVYPETVAHRGFVAVRVRAAEEPSGVDARRVLEERFGVSYAHDAMHRLCADDVAGFYAVRRDADGACVSTFAVVAYATHDGRLACCIDSFAVTLASQGAGVGHATFHALLRGVCARASASGRSYYVFAQCVRTGDARHFWFDKLDESTVARSLLLQAFQVDSSRIPVQLLSQCAPRAREYRSSDLE